MAAKIVDGIDMSEVKADELKGMIKLFNDSKLGTIKAGANPLGSAKAFVKTIEGLSEAKQGKLLPELADYYNRIVRTEEELKAPDVPPAEEEDEPPVKAVEKKPAAAKAVAKAPAAKAPTKAVEKKPVAAKAPAKAKDFTPTVEQNGIKRPKPGTLCGKAWDIFDKVTKKHRGNPATIAESLEISKEAGLNEGNVRAEFGRWRKFSGFVTKK